MSVSVAARSPPVQDSAVASLSRFCRQRSSKARTAAIASWSDNPWSDMSISPGQPHGRSSEGDNAFATPGEAEPFAGRRLYRHALARDAHDFGDTHAHSVAV